MKVRVAAAFKQAGNVLCLKYTYGGKDVFSLPGGGADNDIPLQEVVAKEWREELGVKVDIGDIILIGEAPTGDLYPRTLHIIFEARGILGIPKIQADATCALEVTWVPVRKLAHLPLYPDVGKQLHAVFTEEPRRSLAFVSNCMERGYW